MEKQYTYNKVHTIAKCTEMMKILTAANEATDIQKTKSPSELANTLGALFHNQQEEPST